jgi:hypothetical protein
VWLSPAILANMSAAHSKGGIRIPQGDAGAPTDTPPTPLAGVRWTLFHAFY